MLIALAIAALGAYAFSRKGSTSVTPVSPVLFTGTQAVPIGLPSAKQAQSGVGVVKPTTWPPNPGEPGSVTIGGKPAPTSYSAGNMNVAISAASIAGVGAGAVLGVTAGIAGIEGLSGGAGAIIGATAASAIPIIGAGIAVVGIVLGIIAKHHAAAVAREAQAIAQAVPIIRQRQILIAQAAILGEVNYTQAAALVEQSISDFYSMVKPIQRGRWKWDPSHMDSSVGFNPKGMNQQSPNAHAPDPCNAACWYGHFMAEGDGYTIILPAVQKILSGAHGVMALPVVPSHAAEAGYPEVDMLY